MDKLANLLAYKDDTYIGLSIKIVMVVIIIVFFIVISYYLNTLYVKRNESKKEYMDNTSASTEVVVTHTDNHTEVSTVSGFEPAIISTYEKLQEVTNPSNLNGTGGYIGRDQICFREKLGDVEFMKKRYGCMACQVDKRTNGEKNYDGTKTNIISTCVYGDADNSDPSIWTKEQCKSVCSTDKYKDLE